MSSPGEKLLGGPVGLGGIVDLDALDVVGGLVAMEGLGLEGFALVDGLGLGGLTRQLSQRKSSKKSLQPLLAVHHHHLDL